MKVEPFTSFDCNKQPLRAGHDESCPLRHAYRTSKRGETLANTVVLVLMNSLIVSNRKIALFLVFETKTRSSSQQSFILRRVLW